MLFSPVSLLAIAATSAVGTPVATGDAAALISSEIETRDLKITKRSYAGSCKSCVLKDSVLECKCHNSAQAEVTAKLDLNQCLANANGVLVWRANGNFSGSCGQQSPYTKYLDGSRYWTMCYNPAGDFLPTEVNLNDRIHNHNGVLRCAV
ncbi:Cyanovirin-N [Rhypophila sp. PSN 637]